MSPGPPLRVAVGPHTGVLPLDAVLPGSGTEIVDVIDAEVLIWNHVDHSDELRATLERGPNINWVHLVFAGTDTFHRAGVFDSTRIWTCAKGALATPVAEHALVLTLACLREIPRFMRATKWTDGGGHTLHGKTVTILGGGAIAESLLQLLQPFDGERIVVRRHADRAVPGASETVAAEELDEVLQRSDVVVLALALTDDTVGIIDARRLQLMPTGALVVNVARGEHIVTDDLVDVLRTRHLSGAGLDVTDPEPLPPGHPLWRLDNVVITPHTAATRTTSLTLIRSRIIDNVHRYRRGEPPLGVIDVTLGY